MVQLAKEPIERVYADNDVDYNVITGKIKLFSLL